MVPWAFSYPGDLNYDAFTAVGAASSFVRVVLGSNQVAAAKWLRGSSAAAASSPSGGFAARASGSVRKNVSDSFGVSWFGSALVS